MTNRTITYAGHSAVFVDIGGQTIAIDPWLRGNPLCPQALQSPKKLDTIVLTHGHSDHASDAVRVANTATIVATYELAMIMIAEEFLPIIVAPMNKGGAITLGGVEIRLTNAFHSSSYDSKNGTLYAGEACGALLSVGDTHLFHAGDTSLFSDLKLIGDTYRPDIAFIPIGDRFTMGPKEAATAASWLRCKLAVPIHYKTFDLLTGTYPEFAAECKKLAIETHEIAPGGHLSF